MTEQEDRSQGSVDSNDGSTQKFSEKRGYGVQTSPPTDQVPNPPRSQASGSSGDSDSSGASEGGSGDGQSDT